ncbi:Triose-phosphate Transporter family [Carpediemonas membranifera]|uniref:Triose-phosphate Transporter family n=1 Tax=Carpediemonas membranifera TaxID=201153 RepID=A0A8J6AV60_9EUKA|nr:Triose-phosphate Transporter family [Carpediemonas membranifera]|eukprot:KAG9392385.1 Triose-phosphate Transporter family [Carpediemonas membranifera]
MSQHEDESLDTQDKKEHGLSLEDFLTSAPARLGAITVVSLLFILFFASQTIFVKYDDEELHIGFVFLTAVLLTAGWPINGLFLLIHRLKTKYYTQKSFSIKAHAIRIVKRYLFIGVLDAAHITLLSIGLTALPGSTYMVLKASNNVFNVVLSRIFVGKKITVINVFSVGIITVGIIIMGLAKHDAAKTQSRLMYWVAFVCSLASAFMDAFQAVIAQVLFTPKHGVKKKKELGEVLETAFWNGIVSFCCVLPLPLLVGETFKWYPKLSKQSTSVLIQYAAVAIGVALSKQLGYLFKFFAVQLASALYQSLLDMVRRVVVIFICCVAFGEEMDIFKLISTAMTLVGFGSYTLGNWAWTKIKAWWATQREAKRAAAAAEDEEALLPEEGPAGDEDGAGLLDDDAPAADAPYNEE